MPRSNDDILATVAEQEIEFINLQFTDIVGLVKNVTIPVQQLHDCLDHGVWFDGSAIEGFARVAESDMFLVPDLETYAVIPWDQAAGYPTARMICDVYTPDGKPFAGDPRYILKLAIDDAAQMGMLYNVGPELEFFLFKPGAAGNPLPDPHDAAGYFDVSTDMATHIRRQMVRALAAFGIEVEAAHHEVAIGQHEIDFKYGPALRTADHAVTFRTTLKAVAQQMGLYATFMPKPIAGINGSGMHVHQSLTDIATGKNLFSTSSGKDSVLFRSYIAGLARLLPQVSPMFAPNVNSFRRMRPDSDAPINVQWGADNRSCGLRVPVSDARNRRIENRLPGADANPYLAFAASLVCGYIGMVDRMQPPKSIEGNAYNRARTLPRTLETALDRFSHCRPVKALLGEDFFDIFYAIKECELFNYQSVISSWEREHLLLRV
jgi:glutamine synthetase